MKFTRLDDPAARRTMKLALILALACGYSFAVFADSKALPQNPRPRNSEDRGSREPALWSTTPEEAARRSAGCLDCHAGIEDMHGGAIDIGCVDCHGGDAGARAPQGASPGSAAYLEAKTKAHVLPRFPEAWKSSANPERSGTLLGKESAEFIRFVNPGDLRVARLSCGTSECHSEDVHNVGKSLMTTGAMLWGAALYNNGSYPLKNYRFGESYDSEGRSQRLQTVPQPSAGEVRERGILPFLDPLPRWEITQMGNILRTFERGGRRAADVGLPSQEEPPGRPTQNLLSPRGLGTLLRTDPVFLGLQKTRLLDPMLSHLGT
ncbi:MAG TPA: hypothetical protein VKC34_16025, partial [Blastocatellia bacterium]|nr:hypothetical protein [Blastocatellia bacterium]